MRGRKGSVFRGGIRVPSFWYYPRAFKEARDIKTPAAHYDILPTLAELTGAELPADLQIEGISLLPLLRQEAEDLPERIINRYWARSAPVRYSNVSTRKGNLKLVGVGKDEAGKDRFELFDLDRDPMERHDISENNGAAVATLRSEMDQWLDGMEASAHIVRSPRPIIGTAFENPVMLNRNDAHFLKKEGDKREVIYWDVIVDETKPFNITVHVGQKLNSDGKLELMLGDRTETLEFKGQGQTSLSISNVELKKGALTITPKLYLAKDGALAYTYPFYLEIKG
jgi:arylsulfatase